MTKSHTIPLSLAIIVHMLFHVVGELRQGILLIFIMNFHHLSHVYIWLKRLVFWYVM